MNAIFAGKKKVLKQSSTKKIRLVRYVRYAKKWEAPKCRANFQTLECFGHFKKLIENGTSIILVSHAVSMLQRVATRGIVFGDGRIVGKAESTQLNLVNRGFTAVGRKPSVRILLTNPGLL